MITHSSAGFTAAEKRPSINAGPVFGKSSGMKGLAEAIILQSLEDLCTQPHRKESRTFFGKNGFKTCAEIAGLDTLEQFKILHLLGGRKNGRNSRVH